ncbi:MAG: DNA recombination protein RmuC, partial [Chitinophagaceae bacterium]
MTTTLVIVLILIALLIGMFAGWMINKENQQIKAQAENNLKASFDALAAEALRHNNEAFIALAETKLDQKTTEAHGILESRKQAIDELVKPLGDSLKDMKSKINELEVKREGAYSEVKTWIEQMKVATTNLDQGTRNLVGALKNSSSRGRYGEIALHRLVEFSGMLEHCDFEEQVSTESDNGRLRPDMIIHLPEKREVVVDSKVPLAAYLEMFETEEQEQQKLLMEKHISAIKTHLKQLSSKNYWDQFEEAPDFVVMYMQIESSFAAALQSWPRMIEEALNNRIIIATPTTFISILRSIGYSWNQLKTVENIQEIRDAAIALHDRTATLVEHLV